MTIPAHNSQLPFPLEYHGTPYDSFNDLWAAVQKETTIAQSTAGARLRKRLKLEELSDDLLDECMLLDAGTYRVLHGSRKTWISTTDGKKEARDLFNTQERTVSYQLFRQRLKSLSAREKQVTEVEVARAATFSNADWITNYGGGRRKGFTYDGDLHIAARGHYSSFTAFLKMVGRYQDRDSLNSRRKARWDTDDLLREPLTSEASPGYIYQIIEISTGKAYVGLTVNRPQVRFQQHLRSARDGSGSALHKALVASGAEAFRLQTIEVVDGDENTMAEREIFWIAKIGTLHPEGFNILTGGQIGRYNGLEVEIDGRKFRSISAMCRRISKETDLAEHVIARCWREDRPLPLKARVHSDHPEAGTVPFRQWLSMLKRAAKNNAGVVDAWENYDTWKADLVGIPGEGLLTRIDESSPWGPDNCIRMDHQDIVRRTHGQSFAAFGRVWDTKQDALDYHGVPRNTYDLRIAAGRSVEEALSASLGPTSKQQFNFDGESFPSRNSACEALSQRFCMTPHQVKDYLRREIPSDQWPKYGRHIRAGAGVKVAHEVEGTHYESVAGMCRAYGIAKGTYEKRRRNGWTVERSLKTPIMDTSLVIFGFEWSSSKSACKAFGLAPNTYKSRTTKHGLMPEEALMASTTRGYLGVTKDQALEICAAHAIRKIYDYGSEAEGSHVSS